MFALSRHLFAIIAHFLSTPFQASGSVFLTGQLEGLELLAFNSSQLKTFTLGTGIWGDVGKTEIMHPENFKGLVLTGNCNYAITKWIFNLLKCVSSFSNHKPV